MKATPFVRRRLTELNAKLDQVKPLTEFGFVGPALAAGGAAAGAAVGKKLSGKKQLADGSWVDSNGNPTSAPTVSESLGAAAGGAAGIGAIGAHQAVMKDYGGAAAGAGQAYKNLGRNVVRDVGDVANNAAVKAKAGLATAGAKTGAVATDLLQKLRKRIGAVAASA